MGGENFFKLNHDLNFLSCKNGPWDKNTIIADQGIITKICFAKIVVILYRKVGSQINTRDAGVEQWTVS